MKKILLATLILACSFAASAGDPNKKVLDAFNSTFQHVKNVSWTENEFTYGVFFQQDKVSSRVTYDKEGNILKTIRYYAQEQLPVFILSKVTNKFRDKKVFQVVEESSADQVLYHISLEGDKTWTMITVDTHGYITVDKKYNKA